DAVLQILRYLRGTQFQTLLFPSTSSLNLRAYCDVDWAGDSITRKSMTRFCVFLNIRLSLGRILRYLRGTQFQTLLFPSTSSLNLRAYCDVDWAGDSVTRKSMTWFCVFLEYSFISWKSKKQDVLSRSSTEAEYRAMVVANSEIVWLRWLLADMGVHITSPTPLYCNNRSAIQIARNMVFS
nr:uncharacterized mitochondrial protein AtMg00810-like [Tanacetum cinerariifolium]